MGSSASKPVESTPSPFSFEKQSYNSSTTTATSTSSHHSYDRLARIHAESNHRQSLKSSNASPGASLSLDAIKQWDDKALAVSTLSSFGKERGRKKGGRGGGVKDIQSR